MPWKEVSTMSQRLEFVTLATAENANLRHLCRCFGISPNTAYKWLDRFQSKRTKACLRSIQKGGLPPLPESKPHF